MKKIKILGFFILPLFLFSSCDSFKLKGGVSLRGIEKYHPANSSLGISEHLLPSEDFIEKYSYIEGDYYYIDTGLFSGHPQESELMYLHYEDKGYEEVKQFSLESYPLSSIHRYSYNDYEFFETLLLPKDYDCLNSEGENKEFPYRFNMISYNDTKKTIVFIGFCIDTASINKEDKELLTFSDMGAFLKEYFSFYDFDA